MAPCMATGSGPRQKELLGLKSLAQSTPAVLPAGCLPFALAMPLVLQSRALAMRSAPPVLKSLTRKPCPATDLFSWTLVPSTGSASRPQPSGAIMVPCTKKPGEN